MGSEVVLIPYLDDELDRWDDDLSVCPGATVFHSRAWLGAIDEQMPKRGLVRQRIQWLKILRDGEQVGVFPAYLTKVGPVSIFGSPFPGWETREMGPRYADCDADRLIDGLLAYCRRVRAVYVQVADRRLPPDVMERRGFTPHPIRTFMLDLSTGEEAVWASAEGRARTAVRSAEKKGVRIVEREDVQFADDYHSLLTEVFRHQGKPPPFPLSRAQGLVQALLEARCGKMLAAVWEDKVIATGIFPFDRGMVHYWGGAHDGAYNKLNATNLIQWHVIRWAIQAGKSWYDLYGAVNERIDRFKRSFGAEPLTYHHYVRTRVPFMKYARRLARRVRSGLARRRSRDTGRTD